MHSRSASHGSVRLDSASIAAFSARLLFVVGLWLCTNASAHLIFQDRFNYSDGPLLTAQGSPWVNDITPSNQINVVSGELFLTQTEQESVRYTLPSSFTQGSLAMSFKLRVTALPTGTGTFFSFIRGSASTYFSRLTITTNGAAAGKYRLGITPILNPVTMIPVDFSLGDTHTIVVRMIVNGGFFTSTLWVDPVSETDATLRAEKEEFLGAGFVIAHVGFRQVVVFDDPANGMGEMFVDDFRLGRVFNDVMPSHFTSVTHLGAGGFKLVGAGIGGTNYTILANTNLTTTNWFNLGNATANTNGVIDFTDFGATNRPMTFYGLRP
jgi:hypothetical protein